MHGPCPAVVAVVLGAVPRRPALVPWDEWRGSAAVGSVPRYCTGLRTRRPCELLVRAHPTPAPGAAPVPSRHRDPVLSALTILVLLLPRPPWAIKRGRKAVLAMGRSEKGLGGLATVSMFFTASGSCVCE